MSILVNLKVTMFHLILYVKNVIIDLIQHHNLFLMKMQNKLK
ncbi:hypothetical protein BAME_25270 [Bacillus sp. M 2-6]|nr:hypothetical protein BAME_25270 [Bacillus sp. M 2-6]KIL26435.1 hypothetical protein B4133_1443 [Bacillus altitudinis]VXB25069.1 hypothetical protein BACI9J_130427 [Bacillus altitudinis]